MEEKNQPISSISKQTGVQTVTLRAWERRYGLLKPARTQSGHRLYSESDIQRVKAILELIKKGVAVSKVRSLLDSEQIYDQKPKAELWKTKLKDMISAITTYDLRKLDAIYNETLSLYPVEVMTEQLLLPLLKTLGERWQVNYKGAVAEEHFFSAFMRNKLGARFHHLASHANGERLLFACLPGEPHEFGLLLFAIHIMNRGYEVVYLGGETPVEDIFIAANTANVQGLVLHGDLNEKHHSEFFNLIKKNSFMIFLHGAILHKIKSPNFVRLDDDFSKSLAIIKKNL